MYVEDSQCRALWAAADEPTRDAIDLAYLTGQRPADTLKFKETDIRGGVLLVAQNKTGKRLRIAIIGELAKVIDRIMERKRVYKVRNLRYVRFDKARAVAGCPSSSAT